MLIERDYMSSDHPSAELVERLRRMPADDLVLVPHMLAALSVVARSALSRRILVLYSALAVAVATGGDTTELAAAYDALVDAVMGGDPFEIASADALAGFDELLGGA